MIRPPASSTSYSTSVETIRSSQASHWRVVPEATEARTEEQWSRVLGKLATLYAYGTIRYVDAFRQKRVTTYRMMMVPDDVRTAKGALIVCAEGNTLS